MRSTADFFRSVHCRVRFSTNIDSRSMHFRLAPRPAQQGASWKISLHNHSRCCEEHSRKQLQVCYFAEGPSTGGCCSASQASGVRRHETPPKPLGDMGVGGVRGGCRQGGLFVCLACMLGVRWAFGRPGWWMRSDAMRTRLCIDSEMRRLQIDVLSSLWRGRVL